MKFNILVFSVSVGRVIVDVVGVVALQFVLELPPDALAVCPLACLLACIPPTAFVFCHSHYSLAGRFVSMACDVQKAVVPGVFLLQTLWLPNGL